MRLSWRAAARCSRRTFIRARQTGNVIDEIVASASRYHTRLFMFFHDTFTIHRDRAVELFDGLIEKKRRGQLAEDVHFFGFTRANTLDNDLLELMRKAGCDKGNRKCRYPA
jgi:hypothetical protein